MGAQTEFGAFLRARRDGVRPADVGLDAATGRRVPGLHREEVAILADVSVDYLRRLEQGRVLPSDYPEWLALAGEVADVLRLNRARFAQDERLGDLVDELLEGSETFRALWRRNDVFEKTFGRKVVDHPDVGRLDLEYEAFSVPGSDGQMLIVYTAEPRSATAARLEELAVLVRKSSAPARA